MRAEASNELRPLRPEDLFTLQFLRDARLSPDGGHVAFVVSRTDGEERLEIWIQDIDGGGKQRLSYLGNARAPRWSPDGRWLAFAGDGHLRLSAFPLSGESELLTPEHLTVRGAPSWSPNSVRITVSLCERQVCKGPRRLTSNYFRADELGFIDGLTQHIYEVDRSNHALRCLTLGQGICSQPQWSPCGKYILFIAADNATQFAPTRLLTVGVDGEVNEVLGREWSVTCPRWLPGSDRIAVAAAKDSTLLDPALSLWVVDRSGRNADLRTQGMIGNVGFRIQHDMPAWDLTNDHTLTVLNRDTAFATVQRGGSVEIWRIALGGIIAVEKTLSGDRSCIVLDVQLATNTLLFAVSDLRSPTELWRATLEGNQETRITSLNDVVLNCWPSVKVERLSFVSIDGMEIEAWFMAPAGREHSLPTILFIHGGPHNATGHAFRYDFLLLATQGYGVLFANFRGSLGYGEPFARAIVGDWGARAYPDHMGAIDAAISRGFADPDRLGLWGHSHGGFATCWIVGHTNRFKAAVAEGAVTNFATLYYLSDVPNALLRDLGGRPHEIPDIYRARSPITYAHRCKTPIMLLHGEADLRCPIAESEQFYRALLDVGCEAEFIRIPDCSHMGDSDGPLSARRAQNEALLRWFGEHL